MRLTPKTLLLLAIAVVLGALNFVGGEGPAAESLPSLASAAPDAIGRMSFSSPIQKLTIERVSTEKGTKDYESWRIVTPLEYAADAAQVRALLRTFGPGVPMEALVDEGNLEDYGVDHQAGILVELFEVGQEVPVVSFTIGKPAAGPSSFVRLSGADTVYRADVGGRARYERPASEWRDKVAIEVERADVRELVLVRGAERLAFRRGPSVSVDKDGNPEPGPWTLDGATFTVDTETVEATVRTLGRIRAGEIHNPDYEAGFAADLDRAELRMADGTLHTITLGARSDEKASFVKVDDRADIFRTASTVGRAIRAPIESFRDRAILSFDPAQVESVTLSGAGVTVVLEQSVEGGVWSVAQPANMDADQKQAEFLVNTLATLRAAAIPADSAFSGSGTRLSVRLRDGRAHVLELGQSERDAEDRPLVRVRVPGREGVFQLKEATLVELRKAFGRG